MGASEVVAKVVDLTERVSAPGAGPALGRAAVALNSTLELDEVLDVLAREILASTDAERASVLLCAAQRKNPEEDSSASASDRTPAAALGPRRLEPAVSLARTPDAALAEAFRALPPIELDLLQREAFARARPVAMLDARRSELIPSEWAQRFDLQSVVLVPLFTAGEPCGLLAVDWPVRDAFDDAELELLEAMGELAGVAVGNARQLQQASRRARLRGVTAKAAADLAPPLTEEEIATHLVDAMAGLLETDVVGVGRVESNGGLRPLLVTPGVGDLGALTLADVPDRIVEQVDAVWREGVTRACQLPADPWLLNAVPAEARGQVGSFVLLPLLASGRPVAAVLAAVDTAAPLAADVVEVAETLAALGGAALERCELLNRGERQCSALGAVNRLLEHSAAPMGPSQLRDILNEVLAIEGIEVTAVTPRKRPRRRRLDGAAPTALDRRLWEQADEMSPPGGTDTSAASRPAVAASATDAMATAPLLSEVASDGTRAVVLWARGTPVGTLHLATSVLSREQIRLLAPVAAMAGQLITTGGAHGTSRACRRPSREAVAIAESLTSREGEILHLLDVHMENDKIAELLVVSPDTVKSHVRRILEKLHVSDRRAAAREALRLGVLELVPAPAIDPEELGQ